MKKEELVNILKNIYLFEGLTASKLEELAEISTVVRYMKNNVVFMEGDESDNLIVLLEGKVKVCKHDTKGNKINIGVFKPYSLIAEAATLRQTPFPSSAYCEEAVSIIKIQSETFLKDFMSDTHVSYAIIQSLLGKMQLLQHNINLNLATTAKDKILSFYESNESLKLEMKNYEIACLLGMSPETFSRNVKQLEKENKVHKSLHGYKII